MYKKLLISIAVLIIGIFSFSICFANNGLQDAADNVRNVVGDAENAVEDAARNISNASKDATGKIEEGANNVGNAVMNNKDNNTNNTTGIVNDNYTATRTATTDNTFMGMNATAWTWLIIGIAAIAIVALVWYYSMQVRSSNSDRKD